MSPTSFEYFRGYEMKIDEAVARKVLSAVDAGLVQGKGVQKPGQMCVEAAVCFALGLPHSDRPPCVGDAVRSFKIALNDARWSSDAARAKGMRNIAIAQLGSDQVDQRAFAEYVALETVRRILPIALRAAKVDESIVAACENAVDLNAAAEATHAAAYAGHAAAYAAYAAAAASAAYAAHAAAAAARDAHADRVLTLSADIATEALLALGCEGTQWLFLTGE